MNISNYFTHFGSLISIFWTLLNKQTVLKYLQFILYSGGTVLCILVYMSWNRIPVREHYIQVEHFMSKDTTCHPVAKICLNMNYGSTINEQLPRAATSFNRFFIGKINKNLGKRRPYRSLVGNLEYLLGHDLYKEMIDSCKKQVAGEDFEDIYYVGGMQSVDGGKMNKNHTVYTNNDELYIYGTNDDKIFKSELYNSLGHTIEIDSYLKKGDYQEKDYSSYAGIILSKTGGGEIDISDKKNNGFPNFFKLEDISQSYYRIKIHSNTIDSLVLHVDFVGATTFSKFEYEPDKMDICSFDYYNFQRYPILNQITFHASFQETQNLQVIRCFFLTAIITLLITFALKTLGSIIYDNFIAKKKNKEDSN